ncbi:MAG: FtsH protease activity modulator HflK [Candidatus Margulisiibacteriota bacterium]|nr:FtsH protease activity modulator HflK [Candidatus Margulisiibacteriota bacterium]
MIYFASGLYSLQNGQSALILRFGEFVNEERESGIHYHLPFPIEKLVKVHVNQVQKIAIQERRSGEPDEFMGFDENITGDENLTLICTIINYDVKKFADYLFNAKDIKAIIEAAGQKCLTQELAKMKVSDVMTTGKSLLQLAIKSRMQQNLDDLETGVRVLSVELTDISPPGQTSVAFQKVSDAREKKQEIIKGAEGYANSVVPKARGTANSIISEAEAYAKETLSRVKGKAAAFNDILREYERNPETTARLKYLETLQKIYSKSQVRIDTAPSLSVYYIGKKGNE